MLCPALFVVHSTGVWCFQCYSKCFTNKKIMIIKEINRSFTIKISRLLFGLKAYRETINQFPGKQVQSWSHSSWVTNGELFAKKGFAIPFLKHRQEGEREKNHNGNCKALCIKRKRNEFQTIIVLFHISICSELFEKSVIHDIYASFDTSLS